MADETLRVKLSADGVTELVAALRAVEQQVVRTGDRGQASLNKLGKAASAVTGVMGAMGVALSVGAITSFVRQSVALADSLDDAIEKMGGASSGVASVALAARIADVPIGKLDMTLGTASKNLRDFEAGGGKAGAALRQLGFNAQSFKGLDLGTSIRLISVELAKLEGGLGKNALAADIFGRRAVALIPAFNVLGGPEMERFAQNVERLFSPEAVRAGGQLADTMKRVGFEWQGLGVRFVEGFAPAAIQELERIEGKIGDLADPVMRLGQAFGVFVKVLAAPFLTVGAFIAAFAANVVTLAAALGKTIAYFFGVGEWKEVERQWGQTMRAMASHTVSMGKTIGNAWADIFRPPPALTARAGGGGAPPESPLAGMAKARREADLQAARDANAEMGDMNEDLYRRGLVTLKDYYLEKARLRDEDLRETVAAFEREKRETGRDGEAKTAAEILAIDAKIAHARAEHRRADAAALSEYQEKWRALNQQVAEAEAKAFARSEGDHDAREQLDAELARKYELLLRQRGDAEMDVARRVADNRRALALRQASDEALARASAGLDAVEAQAAIYEAASAAGVMSKAEAQQRILALEKQELPILRALADEAQRAAAASGDPAAIAKAEALALKVQAITNAILAQEDVVVRLKVTFQDALMSGLTEFFATGIQQSKSFLDAVRGMALGVIQAIQQMLAQMLAAQIMKSLFGWGFSGGGAASSGTPATQGMVEYRAAAGGLARVDMTGGGPVRGPGGPVADAIPAWLSNGEFTEPSAVVALPGVGSFLEMLRTRHPLAVAAASSVGGARFSASLPGLRGSQGPHRFADGGLASGSGGPFPGARVTRAELGGQLTVGLEDGLVARELEGPAGVAAIIRVVSRHRRAIGSALR